MPETTNDNPLHARNAFEGPDAHGQAALLLTESLMHTLIARNVISVGDAMEVIEVAADVKTEIAADLGDSPARLRQSLDLLALIGESLRSDAGDGDGQKPGPE